MKQLQILTVSGEKNNNAIKLFFHNLLKSYLCFVDCLCLCNRKNVLADRTHVYTLPMSVCRWYFHSFLHCKKCFINYKPCLGMVTLQVFYLLSQFKIFGFLLSGSVVKILMIKGVTCHILHKSSLNKFYFDI